MGIETAVAVGGLFLSAATTGYSVQQQNIMQGRAEEREARATMAAKAETDRLAAQAKAEAERIANLEKETKQKAIAGMTRLPQTIATSFAGVTDVANVGKKKLLGE